MGAGLSEDPPEHFPKERVWFLLRWVLASPLRLTPAGGGDENVRAKAV